MREQNEIEQHQYGAILCSSRRRPFRPRTLLRGGARERAARGQFQGPLQMVFDLRQGAPREFLEIGVGAVLDLVLEERGISLLVVDLALHIVLVKRRAPFGLERRDDRVKGATQKRIGRRSEVIFAVRRR